MLPEGIRTATLQIGPFLDDTGAPCPGSVEVLSPVPRVWQGDGTVFTPRPVERTLDASGVARLTLPATDQAGFVDGEGRPVADWRYRVTVAVEGYHSITREVELPAGSRDGRTVRLVIVPETLPAADAPPPMAGSAGSARSARSARSAEPAGLGRRQLLGALALALPVAALGTGAVGSAAAASPAVPVRRRHVPALLPAATVLPDDVVIGTEARPRSLVVKSSGAGGTAPGPGYRDTTGRLLLESYQPHHDSYGETIRVHLKDPRAKGMLAYVGDWQTPHHPRSDYTWLRTQPQEPVTIAWIGAHFLDNDDPDNAEANAHHGHINLEVPDSTGALRTRLEVKLIDPVTGRIGTDRSAIRTNLADLEVQVRGEEQLRVVGSSLRDKDLSFATQVGGAQPRWTLRATRGDAHFELRRYLSDGRYQDSPIRVDRYTGEVLVGGDEGTSTGLVVRQDGGVGIAVHPLARGGHGILVAGQVGDPTARMIEGDVTGDAMRRFVAQVDGRLEWGDGSNDRDTFLYRSRTRQLATDGSVHLGDTPTPPRPASGGVIFVSGGALRYRGSAGTVTTLAPA